MKRSRFVFAVSLFLLVTISVAWARQGDIYFQIKKQLTIFSDIYKEVATLYVDELPPAALMKVGIDAMLDSLDPYTTFVDEGEQQQMEILSTGNYGGIGIDAGYRSDRIVVIAPFEGYPAANAGILPGDIILNIDGVSTDGMDTEEVRRLTIGEVGSSIILKIERRGIDQPMIFELERERIKVKNINYSGLIGEDSEIAYIQVGRFGQNAAEELRQKLFDYKENGGIDGLILDLRNNPGGLLNEAVEVVDKFIGPGEPIVETRGRLDEHSHTFYSDEPSLFGELPVVILLNHGSASASEVVAGALQDFDRAVIVGENSFGKGLVQTIRPLAYNTSLKMTVSKYYTPSGRSIQSVEYNNQESRSGSGQIIPDSLRREFQTRNGRPVFDGMGIEPDILIEDAPLSLMETAIRQQNLYFFFVNDFISDRYGGVVPAAEPPEDLFGEFSVYLEQEEFDYQTPADRRVELLETSFEHFSDPRKASEKLQELKQLLAEQKSKSLAESRERIEQELKLEWISRTEGESVKVKESLSLDNYVTESLAILLDIERYQQILDH